MSVEESDSSFPCFFSDSSGVDLLRYREPGSERGFNESCIRGPILFDEGLYAVITATHGFCPPQRAASFRSTFRENTVHLCGHAAVSPLRDGRAPGRTEEQYDTYQPMPHSRDAPFTDNRLQRFFSAELFVKKERGS